jgi:glycosyltransferase involved in cell wall biosynthesis
MKVFLLVPHLSDGGGEKIVSDLSCNLVVDDLVLVVFENKFSYPYKGRIRSLDAPIDRRSLFSRIMGFCRRAARFRRLLKQERPDVVLSFMGEANLLNALLSRNPIVSVHNLSTLAELDRATATGSTVKVRKLIEKTIHASLVRILFRRATVVAVANAVKTELIKRFRIPDQRVVVIANAVNVSEIQVRSQEELAWPWKENIPVVITVGRLTAAKGQWHLIRAFSESLKRQPSQLVILGTGELEHYLVGLTRELGIEQSVFFAGWQPNPYKYMSRANLFVLSSISEGFGLVLLEAMACGLPVVSTDCSGEPREIIAPGFNRHGSVTEPRFAEYGVLIPPFDDKMRKANDAPTAGELQLADTIVKMLGDQGLLENYRNAGLRRVQDYDHATFVEKYQRIIARD